MSEYKVKVYSDGRKYHLHNGKLDCEELPSVVWPDGTKIWYVDERVHRINGPAIVYFDGAVRWYLRGQEQPEEFGCMNDG